MSGSLGGFHDSLISPTHPEQRRFDMCAEKIITDNAGETITIKWDGQEFALVHQLKIPDDASLKVIVMNPREMLDLVDFVMRQEN